MDPISIAVALAQFAPSILRYFGVGESSVAVADSIAKTAQVVTGASSSGEALEMLKANQQAQEEFRKAVMANETNLEQLYLADRQNARARDAAFITAGKTNTRADILAYLAMGSLVSLIVLLFLKGQDILAGVRDLLLILSGSLVAIVKDVYAFEFGSTRDSKEKTNIINNLSK